MTAALIECNYRKSKWVCPVCRGRGGGEVDLAVRVRAETVPTLKRNSHKGTSIRPHGKSEEAVNQRNQRIRTG